MNGLLFGSRVTNRATSPALALRAMTAHTRHAVGCNGPQPKVVVQSVSESPVRSRTNQGGPLEQVARLGTIVP